VDGSRRYRRYSLRGLGSFTAAVAEGIVYLADRATLHAVDAETGEARWTYPLGASTRSAPTIHNGTLFTGTQEGVLHAIHARTGEPQWTFETEHNLREVRGAIKGSPLVHKEVLYIGTSHETLYALAIATGELHWSASLGGSVAGSASTDGNLIFITTGSGSMFALNPDSGEVHWSRSGIPAADSAAAARDGRVSAKRRKRGQQP
jgi:eukaryotic-like serine/threonine-protein kinase